MNLSPSGKFPILFSLGIRIGIVWGTCRGPSLKIPLKIPAKLAGLQALQRQPSVATLDCAAAWLRAQGLYEVPQGVGCLGRLRS